MSGIWCDSGRIDSFDSLRKTAKSFSVYRASYLADLDFMMTGSQNGYSVDAFNCGEVYNWLMST